MHKYGFFHTGFSAGVSGSFPQTAVVLELRSTKHARSATPSTMNILTAEPANTIAVRGTASVKIYIMTIYEQVLIT
jgi:hypothetical protein